MDDCSSDETVERLNAYIQSHSHQNIQVLLHEKNQGKGAALHTGIKYASGDIVVIQDADLEYDPHEYNILIKPILDNFADVVYEVDSWGENLIGSYFFGIV